MTTTQLTFDKLAYVDKLKAAGVDEPHARAHADALDQAFRDEIATQSFVRTEITRLENKVDVATRDLTIRIGGMLVIAVGILSAVAKMTGH